MKQLSRYYYHTRTGSVITDRNLLDTETLTRLQNLLPEDEKYRLKYVTVCLQEGVAGDVDRDSIIEALEVFGQIRDSGVTPGIILRELKKKTDEIVPIVRARVLMQPEVAHLSVGRPRKPAKQSTRRKRRVIRG